MIRKSSQNTKKEIKEEATESNCTTYAIHFDLGQIMEMKEFLTHIRRELDLRVMLFSCV